MKKLINPDTASAPVIGIDENYPALAGSFHQHQRAQLVYAAEGIIKVTTEAGLWVVPPQRAVWIPGNHLHKVDSRRPFRLSTVYFDSSRFFGLPEKVSVLSITLLVRELILATTQLPLNWTSEGPEARLVSVLVDRLNTLPITPLSLPSAKDKRVIKVCEALQAAPDDNRPIEAWARTVNSSPRNLARLFVRNTGITFGAWRQQLRLLYALEALAEGQQVTQVALELGYESVSAFGAMFRRALGETPARYFASVEQRTSNMTLT